MTSKDPSKARMERFAKISEKISQISKGSEASPPQKFERIEQKINDVEETFTTNIDSLEQKYTILKEQIAKFSKLIEDDIIPDVIVVDPPRKGCDFKLLDSIGKAKPRRIVYVSCDPSTLARDLKYLETKGYKTIEVQPVDMFPMTKHIENVALLLKKL